MRSTPGTDRHEFWPSGSVLTWFFSGDSPSNWRDLFPGGMPSAIRSAPPPSPPPSQLPSPMPSSEEAVRGSQAATVHPVLLVLGAGAAAVIVWQIVRGSGR